MNIDRMRILERVMVEVIEQGRRFDMGLWEHEASCGTVCCAGGWLCRDPQVIEQGLNLWLHEPYLVDARGQTHWGFSALMRWLDISEDQSRDLFSAATYQGGFRSSNVSPQMVLRRVRQYISGRRV